MLNKSGKKGYCKYGTNCELKHIQFSDSVFVPPKVSDITPSVVVEDLGTWDDEAPSDPTYPKTELPFRKFLVVHPKGKECWQKMWVVDRYAGATHLIEELTLVRNPKERPEMDAVPELNTQLEQD